MDIADKKLWESVIISVFAGFVVLGVTGGIISSFCYLAPEPALCLSAFSMPIAAVSISAGIIALVLVFREMKGS